jgi:anti-anti-sigma factor
MRLAGDLDRTTAVRLRQELDRCLKDKPPALILDLAGVRSIGAAALRCVYDSFLEQRRAGRGLALCAPNDHVKALLEFVGFTCILRVDTHCGGTSDPAST